MADKVMNISKGRQVQFSYLTGANDALVCVPLEETGLETDASLIDYDTLDVLLAGTSNEQTTMGRKVLASVVVTVDDTNDKVNVDCADIVWTAASGNKIAALLFCYDDDTTTGTDANLVPVTKHDFVALPNGSDITAMIAATGFTQAN